MHRKDVILFLKVKVTVCGCMDSWNDIYALCNNITQNQIEQNIITATALKSHLLFIFCSEMEALYSKFHFHLELLSRSNPKKLFLCLATIDCTRFPCIKE